MSKKKQLIFPKDVQILEQMREQIKLARKRRGLTTLHVIEVPIFHETPCI